MEPLSEAALGVLRDKTIADYLLEHCCRTTAFSKLDHGQKLLDHITQQFKLAGLPVPQTYMKSVDNVRLIRDGGACILSSRLADLSNSVHATQLAATGGAM